MRRLLLLTLLCSGLAFAQTTPGQPGSEIFRCPQADGTIAFQGMPCAESASEDEKSAADSDELVSARDAQTGGGDDPFDFVNPFDEPAETTPPETASRPVPLSQDRAECEKAARDAIDAIDLEMRREYTKAEGQAYMTELLKLTRALRACKEL